MQKNKLIFISPNQNAATESFIKVQHDFLNSKYFLSGGYIPQNDEFGNNLNSVFITFLLKVLSYFTFDRWTNFLRFNLFVFLLNKRNYMVLVQYGTTAQYISKILSSLNIKYYVQFHGYDSSVYDFANKDYYKHVMKSAIGVFVVSNEMKNDLIKIGFREEQLIYNPYGPRIEFETCVPDYESKMVFALGRFVDKKAPYNLVIAFARVLSKVPEAKLIMAGDGPLMNVCKNLALVLGINDRVSFIGVINLDQTKYYMSKSQLFIQHSIKAENGDKEGMPLSILEAQLASLPVVATKHAGIVEIVTNGVNGYLVDENDIDSFSIRIADLLVDSDLCRRMGTAARNNILKNFPLERHLNTIADKLELNVR